VLDLASRHLLGWSMDNCHDAGLVVGALEAAAATRGRHRMDGTIFHSDRGGEGGFNWSSQHRLLLTGSTVAREAPRRGFASSRSYGVGR
jgi:transposase InsO family protein